MGGKSVRAPTPATPATPTAATPAGGGTCASYQGPLTGPVSMSGIAKDMPALAGFLDNLETIGDAKDPDVAAVTLTTAQKSKFGDKDVITFTMTANLASGARSDRLQTYFEGALCS